MYNSVITHMTTLNTQPFQQVFSQYPIVCAYAFGSAVVGSTHAKSDLDIAVVPTEQFSFQDRLKLATQLQDMLSGQELDLSVLDSSASGLLVGQVLKGQPIFVKDQLQKNAFEVSARKKYQRAKHLQKIYKPYLLAAIDQGAYEY